MGAMARDVGRVPVSGLRLPRQWSDARRLGAAARRWSGNAADVIDAESTSRLQAAFEQLPVVFAGAQPVFAHGDFVPVNVIVRDEAVVALLDLERARLAHPLFDAAWFRLIVRHHHPKRWRAIGPSFMAAAGVAETPANTLALDLLAALQCLEMLERTPGSAPAERSDWAARLSVVIPRISPPRLPGG
jgi:aminoglycoside phosphotransferase (APT) family kinase protein